MRFLLEDMIRYASPFATDDGNSTIIITDDNPNDNRHLSAIGMSETLAMSFVGGFIIMAIFEKYRFYKQIYLKRLQNRFRIANRVPPYPSESVLGWFWEIQKISEVEVLRMVGLDAYMCLRFIVVCYKLSLFLSFWGLVVLLPLYSTVTPDKQSDLTSWEKYSISNVVLGSDSEKQRLWFAAIFAYMFSAYFCQLLYAEYNHFSVKRLHYLVQKEADGLHVDPDTPPQKSFTVMIERIPSHLRSAQALFEYFNKLFPGDVFTVEIALDLNELDSKNAKRKRLRDKLEKAIAHYEAKNERLKVYARTGNVLEDDTKDGIFGEDGLVEFLRKSFAPDKFGYELVDALNYYTHKLTRYNQEVKEMQDKYYKSMTTIDKDLQRKLAQRYDTRFAAMFESVTYAGAKVVEDLSASTRTTSQPQKRGSKGQMPLPPRPSLKNTSPATSSSLNGESTASTAAVTNRPSFTAPSPPTATHSLSSPQHPFIPAQHQPDYTATSTAAPLSPAPKTGALSKLFSPLPAPGVRASKILSSVHIEDLLFGPTGNDYRTAYEAEMTHLQSDDVTRRPSGNAPTVPPLVPTTSLTNHPGLVSDEVIPNGPTTMNPIHTQQPFSATPVNVDAKQMTSEQRGGSTASRLEEKATSLPTIREEDTSLLRGESTDTLNHIPITVDDDDARSGTSDLEQVEVHPVVSSLLSDDVTIKEWMKKSSLETDVNESLSTRKRGTSTANIHEAWKRDSQAEMKAYLDSAAALGTPRASFLAGGSSKRPSNVYGGSHHGYDSHTHSREGSSHGNNDPEMRRASELSSLAKSLLSSGIAASNTANFADHSTHSYSTAGGSRNASRHGYDPNGHANYDDHEQRAFANDGSAHQDQYRETASATPPLTRDNYARTRTGGLASILPTDLTSEQLDELTKLSIQRAQILSEQTKVAGTGAWKALLEIERLVEMVTLGAYYKYSSTAFVTFNSRVTESIAQQMLLSPDAMEINHAPNPKDIIWENVAIPKSQIVMRTYITNIGVVVGSIFWSSLVNSINGFAQFIPLPKSQQQTSAAIVLLIFLLLLPFVFDTLARYYEGYKLESEIQNSIMTRYFYYQLINVYVTVGFSGSNLWYQIYEILLKPATIIDVIGGRLPNVSLFFANLMVVKVFIALPLEMVRPYQLSTILLMSNCMDRRKSTRRDLRSGTFYSWPMLYGWIYPQLMMVLMIMVTYCCITPLLMPFCVLFYAGAYVMYKYQLLYVYINEYQSGGYMWYAVFNRSLIALEFASLALIGYLALQLPDPTFSGPFFILLPLPVCLIYFGQYCDHKLKKASENLSYGFARQLDAVNEAEIKEGHKTPHDFFTKTCYRQPSLIEPEVYPEPYRNDGTYDLLTCKTTGETVVLADWKHIRQNRVGSISINVDELVDEGEENLLVLKEYWSEIVLPMAVPPDSSHGSDDGNDDERRPLRRRASRKDGEDVENPPEIATRARR